MGYRLSEMVMDGQMQVKVHYYGSSKPFYDRDEKFYRKHPCVDKVQKLEAPTGPNGEMQTLAEFSYEDDRTDVRDAEGALTRYFYHGDQITQIEHFQKDGGLYSILKFVWEDKRLKGKVLCDGENRPVFSKTFFYDTKGNVVEEVLWGQVTGEASHLFGLNGDGSLLGADHIHKWYHYDSWCNITEEVQDGGISYQYSYKAGTDLLARKLSLYEGKILKREFFLYNEDHLLVEEIVDDGNERDLNNLSLVHQRSVKRYERDKLGFIIAVNHLYFSSFSGSECLIERHVYEYDCHHQICKDMVYDAHGNYRYTLETEYDDRGHVTSQSTPLGRKNLYRYNSKGQLLESEEVGLLKKIYTYDPMGRMLCFEEVDNENNRKTSFNTYDSKGRITSQTDFLGRTTYQSYDAFGRCIQTQFPETKDESEHVYTPCVDFTYDVSGNLASHTNPRRETTRTEYNVFQKPTLITRADGTKILHFYYKNGMLSKTIEPDRTEIQYGYDPFLRMTSKKVYSAHGEILLEESWNYDTFQMLSHTDEKGLTTTFSYDESGKKISEVTTSGECSRSIFYSYDPLGFLQKATSEDISQVEIHDEQGHILEKWEEKGSHKENHTKFSYDDKGLLREAMRITSQGEACDIFSYNSEGRLCQHEDPTHAITQFLYHPVSNDLGQLVLCKMTINALGVKTLEMDDATNRIISREKQDAQGKTLSLEEYFYDRAGNRSKMICTVYLKDAPLKKVTYLSEYDSMGRIVKEIEAGKKITTYSYDEKGRVKTKLLPSGVCLEYRYDGVGRILSMTSSDQSVQYLYTYETDHGYSMTVDDIIYGRTFQRFYNSFGEMIAETSPLCNLSWGYDSMGRNTSFTLPDASSITREYFDGHLSSVTRRDVQGNALYAHTYLTTDANGHVEEERLIYNLAEVHTKHDLLERPYLQTSPWNTYQVGYDALGRVEYINHSLFHEKKISYDPLDQLKQEGDKVYLFDSIGNSSFYETNDCNEVLATPESKLSYDPSGNLEERILSDQTIQYSYDALGRLTSITYPQSKKIIYSYDPFSRLFSRETYIWQDGCFQKDTPLFFLHDHDKEIGALNEHKELVQLKVLGLGLGGDIGAAIAIELEHEVYAPLHDFRGSCIALISSTGIIAETYQIDAFGKEQTNPASPKNPWRFSSKRQEEGLVFFGLRCYDIALERWLTPRSCRACRWTESLCLCAK